MPISSLVLTMSPDGARRERALSTLERDDRLTLGDFQGPQLPVVVETNTVGESIELVREELSAIEGVEFVHVIAVDFSDLESRNERLPKRRKKSVSGGHQ